MKKLLKILFALACSLPCAPSFAAISVTQGSAATASSNANLALMTPTGAQSGDVLVAQIAVSNANATIAAPNGWTEVASAAGSQTGVLQRIYFLNLTVAASTSYTWGISGNSSGRSVGTIYAVSGAVAATCGSSANAVCGGSKQAAGGSTIIAPNVSSQSSYAVGSLRMAFFAVASGNYTISPSLENSATSGTTLQSGGLPGVTIHGSYYLMPSATNGDSQTATVQACFLWCPPISANNVGSTLILTATSDPTLTCVSDDFNRTTGLGSNWVATSISGTFTPTIVGNRLRLTQATTKQSTAVSFQRLFPGSGNYLRLSFKYYGYGGSSTGADGIAVILSDSAYTPQPGGFGGSLGYAPKGSESLAGFAGGWMGLGLDEFGNFSNGSDSGSCVPGTSSCATSRVPQSVALRGSSPYYYWLTGSGTLSTSVSNSTSASHLYRVTVDARNSGRAQVSVERDTTGTGNSYTSLFSSVNMLSYTGQSSLPANLILSLTGSTGDYTNYHEIDDLQVCASTMNTMSSQIDHFRIAVASSPLTCTPANVTIRACMDSTCSTTYSGNVTATLTPTGWVRGDTQTFAGSGGTLQLSKTTAGTYTLGVSGSTPPTKSFSTTLCSIDGGAYSSNCNVTFSDAGLLFSVPAQTSGVDSGEITITAAKKGDSSNACVPAFSGSRAVKFWSNYVSPVTGTMALSVNGTPVASNSASESASTSPTGTSVTLDFNSAAQAIVKLNYRDAGQISLSARYDGSTTNNDSGLVMTGSSTFPVIPHILCVEATDTNWAACSATGAALQDPASCAKFRMAGENFGLRVTGKAYSSGITEACKMSTTPNYLQSNIPIASAVVAPSGGQAGSLTASKISITSGGTGTVTTSESEVGLFTITATPGATDYFGLQVPPGSNTFGRFVPAGFSVGGSLTNRADITACSVTPDYTYLGESLGAAVTINAVNTAGAVTQNYTGSFARLALMPLASLGKGITFGVQSGNTLLNSRLTATCVSCTAFVNGAASPGYSLIVSRASAPDGPFNPATFGVALTDADGVTVLSPDYNWDLFGASEGKSLGTSKLYYGRMRVENAYGSALLALPVPAYVQTWNGTSFAKFSGDSCTTLTVPASVAMSTTTPAALACSGGIGLYGSLAGVAATMGGKSADSKATLSNGDAKLVLGKPSSGSNGYLDLFVNVPDYLKYEWDASQVCSGVVGDNPRARIRFGARSNSAVIYQREVY